MTRKIPREERNLWNFLGLIHTYEQQMELLNTYYRSNLIARKVRRIFPLLKTITREVPCSLSGQLQFANVSTRPLTETLNKVITHLGKAASGSDNLTPVCLGWANEIQKDIVLLDGWDLRYCLTSS